MRGQNIMLSVNSIRKNKYAAGVLMFSFVVFLGLFIAYMNTIDISVTVAVVAGTILALYLTRNPLFGLALLIIFIPFSSIDVLNGTIAGIPGLKMFNLLAVAVLMGFIAFKDAFRLPADQKVFLSGTIILFAAAVIRSISYMKTAHNYLYEEDFSFLSYVQSHLIRPLLIFIPVVLIAKYIRSEVEIKKVLNYLFTATLFLSVLVIILYLFFTPNKADFQLVRTGFGKVLHLHGNNIADFYIAVFPLLLAYLLSKRNVFLIATAVLSIATIGILYSRTAYLTVILSVLLFFLLSGRKRFIPVLVLILAAGFFMIPSTVKDRAFTGVGDNDMNYVTAGRTDDIWTPLIEESLANPVKTVTGSGRYAIVDTEAFKTNRIIRVGHAHNIYLDTILDTGIIGLAFFLFFFLRFIYLFLKHRRVIQDKVLRDVLSAVAVSVIAYLVSGMTGRVFFPALPNSFLWVVFGLGMAIINLNNKNVRKEEKPA